LRSVYGIWGEEQKMKEKNSKLLQKKPKKLKSLAEKGIRGFPKGRLKKDRENIVKN